MTKILWHEAGLMLVAGLLCAFPVPMLLSLPPSLTFFWVGVLLGLTFAPVYALSALAGSKMPERVRNWLGIFALAALFAETLMLLLEKLKTGQPLAPQLLYVLLAPSLFGLLLQALAVAKVPDGERLEAANGALFAYSFPMLLVRWLLVPMASESAQISAVALQTGAIYLLLHGLLRIYWPGPAEGVSKGPLLVRPPIPYAVVALVERTAHRSALPYATDAAGGRDREAISVACAPIDADALTLTLQIALGDLPFSVAKGETVKGKTEVAIRKRV